MWAYVHCLAVRLVAHGAGFVAEVVADVAGSGVDAGAEDWYKYGLAFGMDAPVEYAVAAAIAERVDFGETSAYLFDS